MAPSVLETGPLPQSLGTPPSKSQLPPGVKLIPPEKLDLRADDEIATILQTRRPVTSDKNIWAFWHRGFARMPPWCQRNAINWVRRLGPEWTVHVVDRVDNSDTNIFHYADKSFFPEAFVNNTMDGRNVGQHSGDLIRLPLLWLYGGVWMDIGTLLFRHIEDICWNQIEDPTTPYEMAGLVVDIREGVETMLNGFIAARRHNDFIRRWHETFLAVWAGGKTNATGSHKHPLLRHLPMIDPPPDAVKGPGLSVSVEVFTDYLAHFMCFERLRRIVDKEDGFDGPKYFAEKMFFMPAMEEMWRFQGRTKWSGTLQFELLSAKRTGEGAERGSKRWLAAEDLVSDTLANTSTVKLSHGPNTAVDTDVKLAVRWDSKEFEHTDCEEGTFAAYLRYGSVSIVEV